MNRPLRPLVPAILIRRYKRFLADMRLPDGRRMTAHCPNPGSMLGLAEPGSPALLSDHEGEGRKLRFGWEKVRAGRTWVGVNTGKANDLAEGLLRSGSLPALAGFKELKREVPVGAGSRLDFQLRWDRGRSCFVEVKSVTLARGGTALFPDSVTERGQKHLKVLSRLRRGRSRRAALLFVVQRGDVRSLRPADDIDPDYGQGLRAASRAGVEIYAYRFKVSPSGIRADRSIPVELS